MQHRIGRVDNQAKLRRRNSAKMVLATHQSDLNEIEFQSVYKCAIECHRRIQRDLAIEKAANYEKSLNA